MGTNVYEIAVHNERHKSEIEGSPEPALIKSEN